jgi:hypothetical protein
MEPRPNLDRYLTSSTERFVIGIFALAIAGWLLTLLMMSL